MDGKNPQYDKADEESKSAFQKKLEEAMKAKGIEVKEDTNNESKPKKNPTERFIINTIALMITVPWLALTFIGIMAYGAFAWGYVLYKFWQWFLLPVFPTLPHISISQAVGLMIVVQLFDKNIPQVLNGELVNSDGKNIYDVISPIISFVFGWFVWYFFLPLGF